MLKLINPSSLCGEGERVSSIGFSRHSNHGDSSASPGQTLMRQWVVMVLLGFFSLTLVTLEKMQTNLIIACLRSLSLSLSLSLSCSITLSLSLSLLLDNSPSLPPHLASIQESAETCNLQQVFYIDINLYVYFQTSFSSESECTED